jgi:hypothetical protein
MCHVFNTIGSLTSIKKILEDNGIHDFKSIKELTRFQDEYELLREHIIHTHSIRIKEEKSTLEQELHDLALLIETERKICADNLTKVIHELKQELAELKTNDNVNWFTKVKWYVKSRELKLKIKSKENGYVSTLAKSTERIEIEKKQKAERLSFIISNNDKAVQMSCSDDLKLLDRKKKIIDSLNTLILGAYGEQKVVKQLEHLSDDYYLINDFSIQLVPAVYRNKENDYIKSIQVDHILVGPNGIFNIETKNWSDKTIEDSSLRSPIDQILRSSYILFRLLNNNAGSLLFRNKGHHWGISKITVKNLIVMTNNKPKIDFQYVKVLTLDELIGYINYYKPSLSSDDTKAIAEFLININEKNQIRLK